MHKPLHRRNHVLPRWMEPRVRLIIGQDDHILLTNIFVRSLVLSSQQQSIIYRSKVVQCHQKVLDVMYIIDTSYNK